MATVATQQQSSARLYTITLSTLNSSTGLNFGRAGTAVVSTALDCVDYMVGGLLTTSSSVTPTGAKQIEIWSYATYDSNGSNYNGGATGSDADLTTTLKPLMRLITILPIPATTTTSQAYTWGPYSIAQTYGGALPPEWGLFITQNSCQNLHGSTNSSYHQTMYTPIYYQSS